MTEPTYSAFSESLNSDFALLDDGAEQTLKLIEVSERKSASGYEQFSLTFRGANERAQQQQIFQLDHPRLGQFEIFLVPIKSDQDGIYYQAIFNRISQS